MWHVLLALGGAAILLLGYIPGSIDLPAPERDQDGYGGPALLLRR
ncbi:hypothetical protein [Nocardioides sp. NPDC047086]